MRERVDGVAVVGAGVAGLSLAAALRGWGVPVEVATVSVGGSIAEAGDTVVPDPFDRVLHLWAGAVGALEALDLAGALAARAVPLQRMRLLSAAGDVIAELTSRDGFELAAGIAVRASALLDVLRGACRGVPINTGRRVLGYSEDDQGVVLTFEGGWPLRSDVVVGADGVASAIRSQCLDDGPPMFSGDSVWEGIGPRVRWLAPGTMNVFWGTQGVRAGAMSADPDGAETAWWIDLDDGVGGARERGRKKPELVELLDEMEGPLLDLVRATPEAAIHRSDVFARRRARTAGRGRVTLIGDAAHALPITLRTGASLAIEDGVALARALGTEPHPELALRRFESERAPRVERIARGLWRLRAFEAQQGLLASRARDSLVAHMHAPALRRALEGLAP